MRFYWGEPTEQMTSEDQARWSEVFKDVTFACTEPGCGSEDTVEAAELVPAGTHHMVTCHRGHTTVGQPPARYRRPQPTS